MKLCIRITMAIVAIMSIFAQTVSADELIKMVGKTDADALGVTIMATEKNADLDTLLGEDIYWIDQQDIGKDGSFSISIPVFLTDNYELHSNALSYSLYDPQNKNLTLYISSNGSDLNSGESTDKPYATLAAASAKLDYAKEIVILDDIEYSQFTSDYLGDLTIRGLTGEETLSFSTVSTVNLKGNLKIDNLNLNGAATIFANGYELEIGNGVVQKSAAANSTEGRLTVYGGSNGSAITADTSVKLYGGSYLNIYGGSKSAALTGNTSVILGGTINSTDSINDKSTTNKPICRVYGGGNNAAVSGKTYVEVNDSATAYFIYGAGYNVGGTVGESTNVVINSGSVMNVYGGAPSAALTCDTDVTLNGGKVEAIFGGSDVALTGNTFVNLLGGQVTRRVYSGCYNNVDIGLSGATWATAYSVNGTTTLSIGPDVALNTKNGLDSDNAVNVGVFAGSRIESHPSTEKNMIIYLDDCYSAQNSKIGEKSKYIFVSLSSYLKSYADYVVKSGTNGKVYGTGVAGQIYIAPNETYYGIVDSGSELYYNEAATVASTTTVEFKQNFAINSVTTVAGDTSFAANVSFAANNLTNETAPCMYAVVFDSQTKRAVGISKVDTTTNMTSYTFNLDCVLEAGKAYDVKVFIWNSKGTPLTSVYHIIVNK